MENSKDNKKNFRKLINQNLGEIEKIMEQEKNLNILKVRKNIKRNQKVQKKIDGLH